MGIMEVLTLVGGLGLFLFGIKIMGEGLEKAAGSRMKRLLEVLTRNRFAGVLVGALVTGVIQSSSATTVMVVGFVNAGLLPLRNAVSVIMGANIGTTVTSLMLSVQLDFGVLFAAAGAVCLLIGNRPTPRLMGQILMGLGILFVGMNTMTSAMAPLRDFEPFRAMMAGVSNPVLGVLLGAGITAILQSSSASVGILQALAAQGLVSIQGAMFILFGQNIGTCITALLAATGTNANARRAAVVHLLFNIAGTAIFMAVALLLPFSDWIVQLAGDNLRLQIAFAHIAFNVGTTAVLLPFTGLLERASRLLVRDKRGEAEEEPMRLLYYDPRLLSTPPVAAAQLVREACRLGDLSLQNLSGAMNAFLQDEGLRRAPEIERREEVADYLNAQITEQLVELRMAELSGRDAHMIGALFHIVNDMERVSDHALNILETAQERRSRKVRFSDKAEAELQTLYRRVEHMVILALDALKAQEASTELLAAVEAEEEAVDLTTRQLREHHLDRLKAKKCTAGNGVMYMDMLTNLERVADHAVNVTEAIADASATDRRAFGR